MKRFLPVLFATLLVAGLSIPTQPAEAYYRRGGGVILPFVGGAIIGGAILGGPRYYGPAPVYVVPAQPYAYVPPVYMQSCPNTAQFDPNSGRTNWFNCHGQYLGSQ